MLVSRVSWSALEGLRTSVLGWAPGPVPGDEEPETIHLAHVDTSEQVWAAVSFAPRPCPDRPHSLAVYLWGMAVAPQRQRQGMGRRLIQEASSYARTIGAAAVWADVRQDAVAFYERWGAATVGEPYSDEITGLVDRRVVFDLG